MPRRRRWSRWLSRAGLALVAVVALDYVAVHVLAGARQSWGDARTATPAVLVLALVLEASSVCCYSGLTRAVLPGGPRPGYGTVLAVDLTGNGFSHVVPGGGATAAALRYRLLGRVGVQPAAAVTVAALESAVTTLWLVVAFVLGLFIAVPNPATHPFLRSAAVLAVLAVGVVGGLVAVLMARPDQVETVADRVARHLPLVGPAAVERAVRAVIAQISVILHNPSRRRLDVLWGFGNWFLDASALYVCLLAFGVVPNPGGVLATYGLVCLLALLPVTPGGLGLVEGVAVPALVSFSVPNQAALLGVVTWRLLEFWLPIPVGLVAYAVVRVRFRDTDRRSPTAGAVAETSAGSGATSRRAPCRRPARAGRSRPGDRGAAPR